MNKDNQIVVASTETLQELIASTVKAELALLEQRIIAALPEKKPVADRLYTKGVAEYLDITRQTVNVYAKDGTLPRPRYNGRRAYWLKEEIKQHLKSTERGYKYDL